jgi:ribosomal-protein-alanine N-acetyltransferase
MLLRLATPDDVPRLLAIARSSDSASQWSEHQWRDIFASQSPPRLVWICEEGGGREAGPAEGGPAAPRALGFLVAQGSGADWDLENLAVLPEFRRRGAGMALLGALLAEAPRQGAERILLEVRASNLAAIRLYEGFGFRLLARRSGYYAHPPEDALIYVHSF